MAEKKQPPKGTEYLFINKPTPQIEGDHSVDPEIAIDVDLAFTQLASRGKIAIDRLKLQNKPNIEIPLDDPKLQDAIKDFNDELDNTAVVHVPPLKKE